ncbi:unnamed protein product, partial [marine sediment metagenome]
QSVSEWKKEFDWESRIAKRDLKIIQAIEKKITKSIVEEKYQYHKQVSMNVKLIRSVIATVFDKIKNKEIKLETLGDINTTMWVFERLVRLDLFLLGEPEKILLKFKGDITISDKDKEIALLSDEKLDEYINTLSEGTEVPLLSGKEEKRDTE